MLKNATCNPYPHYMKTKVTGLVFGRGTIDAIIQVIKNFQSHRSTGLDTKWKIKNRELDVCKSRVILVLLGAQGMPTFFSAIDMIVCSVWCVTPVRRNEIIFIALFLDGRLELQIFKAKDW